MSMLDAAWDLPSAYRTYSATSRSEDEEIYNKPWNCGPVLTVQISTFHACCGLSRGMNMGKSMQLFLTGVWAHHFHATWHLSTPYLTVTLCGLHTSPYTI